jgi:Zn-dependent protease
VGNLQATVQFISVAALPLIFAITVHEAAHGWVANKLGDNTARAMGRLTFNPIPHIDPVGTILLPLVMMLTTGFIFGWAKPVPVDLRNLSDPRRDWAIISLAGPASNFVMALGWALIWKLAFLLPESAYSIAVPLMLMGKIGVTFNIILMVLNLIPLPPLDGSRVLGWLLPPRLAMQLDKIEPYGIFILIGLLYLGLWTYIIGPATDFFVSLITTLFSL